MVIMSAVLSGCAFLSEVTDDPFGAPGQFHYLRCEDIAQRLARGQEQELQLRALMDRAGTGADGSFVNAIVYAPDLKTKQSELRELRQTAAEKKCPDEVLKSAVKPDIDALH